MSAPKTSKLRPAILATCALLLAIGATVWRTSPNRFSSPASTNTSSRTAATSAFETNNDSGLTELAKRGLGPELDRILEGTAAPARFTEFRRVFVQWLEQNPEAALAYLRKMKPSSEYDDALLLTIPVIAKTNPERAIRLMREMTRTPSQRQIYAVLFDQLAASNLESAVHLLDSVTVPEGKTLGLRAVAARWAMLDSDSAIDWAKGLGTRDRQAAMEIILDPLTKDDPARTLELAKEYLTGPTLLQIGSKSLIQLGADDTRAAADMMTNLPPAIFQTPAALEIVRALADTDPDRVLNFLTNFPSAAERRIALNNVLDIWSNSRPEEASHYVAGLPAGDDQNEAANHLAQRLAASDPDQAIQFATSLKSNSARDTAMLYIASGWARQDPASAAQWSVTIPAGSTSRAEAIDAALSFWILDDVKSAAEWMETLPSSDQIIAAKTIAPALAQKDPESAITWAANLPSGDGRDAAMQQVITRWAANQPEAAARWVQTEDAGPTQSAHVELVATAWMKSNPTAVRSWVEGMNISSDSKTRILGH